MPRFRTYIHPEQLTSSKSEGLSDYFTCYHDGLYDDTICQGSIGIRRTWPSDQIKRVAAAFMSTRMGLGLQQTYKRYMADQPDYSFPAIQVDREIEDCLESIYASMSDAYAFHKPQDSKEGEFFSGTSLFKALSALDCAHHAAQRGYLLEPLTLTRSAIEIISWARGCIDVEEGGEYLSLTTNSAITQARVTLPGLSRLYGILSKFAHWHPDVHLAFLVYDTEVNVAIRSVEFKPSSLLAVSTGHVLSLTTFVILMRKYWPDVALKDCFDAGRELINQIAYMREEIGIETRFERLLMDLMPCWEATCKNFSNIS